LRYVSKVRVAYFHHRNIALCYYGGALKFHFGQHRPRQT
jgi:hypothetical protein